MLPRSSDLSIQWQGGIPMPCRGDCNPSTSGERLMSARYGLARLSLWCCGLALLAGCVDQVPDSQPRTPLLVNGFPVSAPPVPQRPPAQSRLSRVRAAAPAATLAAAGTAERPAAAATAPPVSGTPPDSAAPDPAAQAEPAPAEPAPDHPPPQESQAPPPPAPAEAPQTAAAPPAEPHPPEPRPPAMSGGLSRIVGFDQSQVLQLLGRPRSDEEVPPARMWRYGSENCQLRVYFYMEMQTRSFRVLSYDLTSHDHAGASEQQCLSEFAAQAAPRSH